MKRKAVPKKNTGGRPKQVTRAGTSRSMRQFHDTYARQPKLAALLRELNWTQNLLILARAKRPEEREFYSLSRSLSPALVAEYQTALPDKQLLQRRLHEFYQLALSATEAPKAKPRKPRRP